jgi:hypothetical protein
MSSLDTAVAVRASHDAVLTYQELRGLGVTKAALAHAVKTGVLAHPHREVYVLNDQVVDPMRSMARAALTAGPDGAVVSHLLAAQVYRLDGLPAPTVADLTVRHDVGHRVIRGIALHRSDSAGLLVHRGLPLTPVARTLADVAGLVRPGELLSGVDSALRVGLLDVRELLAMAGQRSHVRNADILRWVAGMADGRSDSPLESWLRMVLVDGGLGPVELQIPVVGGRGHVPDRHRLSPLPLGARSSRPGLSRQRRSSAEGPTAAQRDPGEWVGAVVLQLGGRGRPTGPGRGRGAGIAG